MKHVIIGAGAAGISAVKQIRQLRAEDEIIMISEDEDIYSRCLLHFYLDGRRTLDELNFAGVNFAENSEINWKSGEKVINILPKEHTIQLESGEKITFDKLCIASGAYTNQPPIPGLCEAGNVVGFRNLDDVNRVKEAMKTAQNIFVIGAGLIGIDVIEGLLKYNKNITLVDMGPHLLPLQLDKESAKRYEEMFKKAGVKQFYNIGSKQFVLDSNRDCYKVILTDGTEILTDLVINCAGVRAETRFFQNSGIECNQFGVITDAVGQTNMQDIYAAGDVTGRKTIWPEAVREGKITAFAMCGETIQCEDYLSQKASMNFLDIPTVSIGKVNQCDETYQEGCYRDIDDNYMKIVYQDGIVKGAILQENLEHSGFLTEAVRNGTQQEEMLKEISQWNGIIHNQ